MRRVGKFDIMVGVVALVGSLLAVPSAVAQDDLPAGGTFVDDDGSVHEPAIEAIAAAGITSGCTVDRFCPDGVVSRGQMASFLAAAVDTFDPATRDWFSDDDSSVHESAINVIAENGVALGFGDGTFRPNASTTRGQMATFLARALDTFDPATRDWFSDDDSSVHESAINVIAENGVTVGFGDGTFRPNATTTRGQMATFLMRALGLDPIVPPPVTHTTVYFHLGTLDDDPIGQGPFLVPVDRRVPKNSTPATEAMRSLLVGPSSDEAMSVPAISSEIPDGTALNGVVIADGIATVDLSAEFESGGGSASMLGRVAQVVHTLTQFSTVDEVAFELDGVAIDTLGGEGVVLEDYNSRAELFDQLPSIFVDQPAYGGEVGNPLRIVGWSVTFEASFEAAIVDADGLILVETGVMGGLPQVEPPSGGIWSFFDTTIAYEIDQHQMGALIVWEISAKDGSQTGVREYPIMLRPAG